MPGVSGVTVVTTLVCFFISHTRLRALSERPAFPAPSIFLGRKILAQLGRPASRQRGRVSNLRRHCEERKRRSNPGLAAVDYGLLRLARNDDVGRWRLEMMNLNRLSRIRHRGGEAAV